MVGQRYGRWTVTRVAGRNNHGVATVHVRCDCGGEKILATSHLLGVRSRSCGCLAREWMATRIAQRQAAAKVRIGQRYSRLSVAGEAGRNKWGHRLVSVRCDCGVEKIVKAGNLASEDARSCGCLQREVRATAALGNENFLRHGYSRLGKITGIYKCWVNMRSRCDNPKATGWHRYGGKGVSYEPLWEDFVNFLTDMPGYFPHAQLSRNDHARDYSKDNCEWLSNADHRHKDTAMRRERKLLLVSEAA